MERKFQSYLVVNWKTGTQKLVMKKPAAGNYAEKQSCHEITEQEAVLARMAGEING